MDIFKAAGQNGKVYYVFPYKVDPDKAIAEAAHASKNARHKMQIIPVWVKGDELYLDTLTRLKGLKSIWRWSGRGKNENR